MKEKKKSWFKRHPVIFGLLIALVAIFIIGFLYSYSEKIKFIDEYNVKLDNVNKLTAEHEELRMEVNSNLNNFPLYYEKIEEYIEWVEIHGPKIYEFQLFVESNHEKLRDLGVNPNYVRDNVISLTRAMQENEVKFREILAYYKRMRD